MRNGCAGSASDLRSIGSWYVDNIIVIKLVTDESFITGSSLTMFLFTANRVSSVIYCRPNSRSNFGGSITCSSEQGGRNVRNLELIVVPCISLNDCDLKIRPHAVSLL